MRKLLNGLYASLEVYDCLMIDPLTKLLPKSLNSNPVGTLLRCTLFHLFNYTSLFAPFSVHFINLLYSCTLKIKSMFWKPVTDFNYSSERKISHSDYHTRQIARIDCEVPRTCLHPIQQILYSKFFRVSKQLFYIVNVVCGQATPPHFASFSTSAG